MYVINFKYIGYVSHNNIYIYIRDSFITCVDLLTIILSTTSFQLMSMFALLRRLEDTKICLYAVNGGNTEEEIKKNEEDLASWSTTYNVSRKLGE